MRSARLSCAMKQSTHVFLFCRRADFVIYSTNGVISNYFSKSIASVNALSEYTLPATYAHTPRNLNPTSCVIKKILSCEEGYSAYGYEYTYHLVCLNNSYYQELANRSSSTTTSFPNTRNTVGLSCFSK